MGTSLSQAISLTKYVGGFISSWSPHAREEAISTTWSRRIPSSHGWPSPPTCCLGDSSLTAYIGKVMWYITNFAWSKRIKGMRDKFYKGKILNWDLTSWTVFNNNYKEFSKITLTNLFEVKTYIWLELWWIW